MPLGAQESQKIKIIRVHMLQKVGLRGFVWVENCISG